MELEITRRAFLVLAASAPLVASLPALALEERSVPPAPEPSLDELPISGLAGECSGRF
ncbi:MAG TPA: hypothetical protein VFF73_27580 [Planctomycetota bacterium]|nr:hypothetical protein [Planctomycetota bacterium]